MEGRILLEDEPGAGKTILARAIAASMSGAFKRPQCTPDLLPCGAPGVSICNQPTNRFEFRPAPVTAGRLARRGLGGSGYTPPAMPAAEYPHRRYNPLTGEWVLVSPQRTARPWQGQVEDEPPASLPAYDPHCYLCPGNARAGGVLNPPYETTFVFTNDYAALLPDEPPPAAPDHPLFRTDPQPGTCRVLCFSPRHDLTLARMPLPAIRQVVDLWGAQTTELGARYRWVQIFENRGAMMGASNPHPHGQVWATRSLPREAEKEDEAQRAYFAQHASPLLLDYARLEAERGIRTVYQNDHWLAVVPFWAVWPFETLLLPRRRVPRLPDLDSEARGALAAALKDLLTKYDGLFHTSFPYSMGWHGAPCDPPNPAPPAPHWQLHAHFYPPLLRSATIRKFMVGYEMLGEPQRDLTPEQAAARLRG